MDVAKSRLKTASNGSLHSTYTSYGSHYPSSTTPRGQIPPRRRALRNVNPNSILPPSPGPLASMLKTTTETGDISVFSIQPSVTPTAYHQLPRSRLDMFDGTTPPRYTPRKGDNFYYTDDHRQFRSYRDTTSEIISLYGYDNQAFYMTPGSPMLDDNSHRSYSITTNGSRKLPSQKSSGTMQSHSSGSGLQRPRSPFPYPTRLKRPGVRPASPALAENGCIDYSRMIELDHVSQRTVHGSYRAAYNNWPRRQPPLSLRPDYNRSTASLPSRASPGPFYLATVSQRSRTPSSSHSATSRHGRFERHARITNDGSGRSPSLTSIVDMYRRPSTAKGTRPPPQMAGSFYYDYSEDFDKPVVPQHDVKDQVLVESPQLLADSGQNGGEHVVKPKDSHRLSNHEDGVEIAHPLRLPNPDYGAANSEGLDPEHKPEEDTTKSSEANDTELSNLIASERVFGSASPDSEPPKDVVELPATNEPEILCINQTEPSDSSGYQPPGRAVENPESDCHVGTSSRRSGSGLARCTLDPTLPDFASIFSAFDQLGKSPCFKAAEISASRIPGHSDTDSIASLGYNVSHQRHRRNVAAVRVSTTSLHDECGHHQDDSTQKHELDILSPEPISPARGLKVKNSIPQLMKALPPLPSGIMDTQSQDQQQFEREVDQFSDQGQQDRSGLQDEAQGSEAAHETNLTTQEQKQAPPEKQVSPPKFKVRVKASYSPLIGSDSFKNAEMRGRKPNEPQYPIAQAKPRLKLKLSRSQIGQGRQGTGQPFSKLNRLKQCNSLADLALYTNAKPRAGQLLGDEDNARDDSQSDRHVQSTANAQGVENNNGDNSPQPSDPFNIPYPCSPRDEVGNKRSLSSSNKDTLVQRPSCSSDTRACRENGLRKKISIFRLRIAESFTANPSKKCKKSQQLVHSDSHISIDMTTKGSETNFNNIDNNSPRYSSNTRSDWMTNRVRRWALDAKRALRSYVRRTLDRSSRWSE